MNHPTDAELLDLALLPEDADPRISGHVAECSDCGRRFEEVRSEQALLRRAYAEVEPPLRLSRRAGLKASFRWAAAAALLLALGVGAAASLMFASGGRAKESRGDRRGHPVLSVKQMERELDSLVRKISDTRDALAEPAEALLADAYLRLLSEGEDRYVDLLSSYCALTDPLADDQKIALKTILGQFRARSQVEERGRLEAEFVSRLTHVLSDEQDPVVRAFLRQQTEEAWARDIDALVGDLAEALDLRFSELEPVRDVLTHSFPKSALEAIPGGEEPADVLIGEPLLSGRVRRALRPDHHVAFDAFLAHTVKEREGVRRAMLRHRK